MTVRIVYADHPNGSDPIYQESGFFRELQILNKKEEIIHKSGLHHPEANIVTSFKGDVYLALRNDDKNIFKRLK